MANFPNMNERVEPQEAVGMGSPAITGADDPETAALKKSRQKKTLAIVAGIAIVILTLVASVMLMINRSGSKNEETAKAPTKAASSITAQDEYRRQVPNFEPPKPAPQPQVAVAPEPVVLPKPVPVAEEKVLLAPAHPVKPMGKTEPTLLDKKLAAPMMGSDRQTAKVQKGNTKPARAEVDGEEAGKLGEMMKPMRLAEGSAERAKNRHLTLSQGTFINCIMETAVDTSVPGMVSCRIPENIFSMDGRTLLIERGARVFGEYRGAVQKGLERIFMLWTKIETPQGVIINIDSPATDGIGRAGATGDVNHHWWRRFGNALLFSILDDAFQFAMDKARESGDGVNYYSSSQSGMETLIQELIREAGDIPPTMRMNQGTRVGIFVARSIDMSNVYRLEAR